MGVPCARGNGFVHEIAPRGLNSAVMGVFGGCNSGGGFLGALVGGLVYRRGGGAGLFGGCGAINFALAVVAAAANVGAFGAFQNNTASFTFGGRWAARCRRCMAGRLA